MKANPKKIKVNYICWERNDAIGKVSSAYLDYLGANVNLNLITLRTKAKNKSLIVIKNLVKLSKTLLSSNIVHLEEPKNLESNLILVFRPKKSILTVHHLDERKKGLLGYALFLRDKWKHSAFTKVIAVSEKTKDDLIKYYKINPDKIKTVYSGVDKKIFKPTKTKPEKINGDYILYLGSEVPRKNINNLLKAFKEILVRYPNLILVKAGYSGGEKFRKDTIKLIKYYKLENKVFFVSDYLKEEDLPKYYSNAELFLYPTLQEGFGMPLVEAMACGCPVVTSNISPMKEIACGQEIVDPYEYKKIVNGMEKILSNKKYKETLKKRAIDRAKDFDWEKSAKKIIEVYKELDE